MKSTGQVAIIGGTILILTLACAPKKQGDFKAVVPPVPADQDPLAGQDLAKVWAHGHTSVEVHGRLVCRPGCNLRSAHVLAKENADSRGWSRTSLVVESDGSVHGTLAVAWGSHGGNISYFPHSLVFAADECRDTEIDVLVPGSGDDGVDDPWELGDVVLRCDSE